MAKIKNLKAVEDVLGRWCPEDLAFIERLDYSTGCKGSSSTLELVGLFQRRDIVQGGWPCREAEFYRVGLLFEGVRDLFVKNLGEAPKQILGFDIIDISDKEWEYVRFKIEDYEDHQIGFLCNKVKVLFIEQP